MKKVDFESEERKLFVMASSLSKREELLGLISELQCHECKNVPGSTQKDRYSCIDAAHTLCEEHKAKCPCGSLVGKSPSPFIAKFLQDKPWMCQNYKTGCRESKLDLVDLEHHQVKCIFRQVFCPRILCGERKILFKDVIDHLKTCLKWPIFEEEIYNGEENKFLVTFNTERNGLKHDTSWIPGKMTSSCGAVFFKLGFVENKTFYIWICLLGSSDEAKKYSCTYSIKNEIFEKFIYSGPVHTIDKGKDDIIASEQLLMMGTSAAQRSLNDEKQLSVEITIKNLKEEAKDYDMESGVSDGE